MAAIVQRNGKNPHLQFYRSVIEQLAKDEWKSVMPRRLPSSKFIFIDTVISGRAICEIFDAFEEEGLNECFFILLMDEDGSAVRGEYRARIDRLVAEERCSTVSVKTLFTEDRGPAVSGVWSTVYPEVMEQLQGRYNWSRDCYGAGSFYWKVSSSQGADDYVRGNPDYNMPITHMNAALSIATYTGVTALLANEIPSISTNEARRMIDYQLHHAINLIAKFEDISPLDMSTTKKLAEPRVKHLWPNANISVSGSHLVRVGLPEVNVRHFFDTFEQDYLNVAADALGNDDGWFLLR